MGFSGHGIVPNLSLMTRLTWTALTVCTDHKASMKDTGTETSVKAGALRSLWTASGCSRGIGRTTKWLAMETATTKMACMWETSKDHYRTDKVNLHTPTDYSTRDSGEKVTDKAME